MARDSLAFREASRHCISDNEPNSRESPMNARLPVNIIPGNMIR